MSTLVDTRALKEAHRKTWASGHYPSIAELVTDVGEQVVRSAGIRPGAEVLDVAAGSGNASIPAAQAGGTVIASDLTPELFEVGRSRAADAGVEIEWVEADAEDLPFEDARFEYVLSSIGIQFAPRHEVVASELVRVCRPGGTITLGNWTADGYIGQFWTIMGPYMPKPPAYASPPAAWGRMEHVAELFTDHPVHVSFEQRTLHFEHESAAAFIDMFADLYGPTLMARRLLSEDGRWEELRGKLIEMSERSNVADDGSWAAPSDYLVITLKKDG